MGHVVEKAGVVESLVFPSVSPRICNLWGRPGMCVCVCVFVHVCVYAINCHAVVLALIVWDDPHNGSILVKLG